MVLLLLLLLLLLRCEIINKIIKTKNWAVCWNKTSTFHTLSLLVGPRSLVVPDLSDGGSGSMQRDGTTATSSGLLEVYYYITPSCDSLGSWNKVLCFVLSCVDVMLIGLPVVSLIHSVIIIIIIIGRWCQPNDYDTTQFTLQNQNQLSCLIFFANKECVFVQSVPNIEQSKNIEILPKKS